MTGFLRSHLEACIEVEMQELAPWLNANNVMGPPQVQAGRRGCFPSRAGFMHPWELG